MTKLKRPGTIRTGRVPWPAIVAVALVAAVAGGGVASAKGTAQKAAKAKIKGPKLKHGELQIDGSSADDVIVVRLRGGHPDTIEVDGDGDGTADFSFARVQVTSISIDAGSGDDSVRIDESGGVFTDTIPTTIDGSSGNDQLIGGSGAERFVGDSGNDFVDGNRGADTAALGSGNDTFQWDPGDGSDTIEGDSGRDTMLFNGSNI